jgi:hypothetical protein
VLRLEVETAKGRQRIVTTTTDNREKIQRLPTETNSREKKDITLGFLLG